MADPITATNPQTGETVAFVGGRWVPAGAARGPRDVAGEQKRLAEALEQSQTLSQQGALARQFIEQNRTQPTGGGVGGKYDSQGPVMRRRIVLPWLPDPNTETSRLARRNNDPTVERLRGLTSAMQKATRVPGEGTTSDVDVMLAQSMVPNATSPGSTNLARANAMALEEAIARDKAQRMAAALSSGQGLANFDQTWAQREAEWRRKNMAQLMVGGQRPSTEDGVTDLGAIR